MPHNTNVRRRFFVHAFGSGRAVMEGEAAHHVGRVLRAEAGQMYELSDGREVWLARIERVARDAVEFSLVERIPVREPALRVTLLLSVVKFDRFEWCLEKATELGVAEIVPVAAARCEKGLLAAAPKRAERWEKILVESAQQSRRLRPPVLAPLHELDEAFFAAGAQSGLSILLSERPDAPYLKRILEGKQAESVYLAIGPEGGWTEAEASLAAGTEFEEASLGALILRTETAVIAALAALNYALGE